MLQHDLLIVTDATASMGTYLAALEQSIPEIVALSKLTGAFERIGVIAYRDYSDAEDERLLWSGWNASDLREFVAKLVPDGGGDLPEAGKTALITALTNISEEHHTIIIWYADAPPHHPSQDDHFGNRGREVLAFPDGQEDWAMLAFEARRRRCTVFSFIQHDLIYPDTTTFFTFLSSVTNGLCIGTKSARDSAQISRMTMEVLLAWIGQSGQSEKSPIEYKAYKYVYRDLSRRLKKAAAKPDSEVRAGELKLLPVPVTDRENSQQPIESYGISFSDFVVARDVIASPEMLARPQLVKRFTDEKEKAYRETVYSSLGTIIDSSVVSLTVNPVFALLWRTICKYGTGTPELTQLASRFSIAVARLKDETDKVRMKIWLEESFDASEEIERIVAKADKSGHGWCVYLDADAEVEISRVDLLEVSRTCHSRVLCKVSSIFTHLRILEQDAILAPDKRTIPLDLPPASFFRLLPHLVVKGTLWPPRAAALSAILAILTGVPFLQQRARDLVGPLKGTWLDLEVPENISFECAKLLIQTPVGLTLTAKEREVYEAMNRYRLLELNLDSTLDVQVPWTPDKTREVGDVKLECKRCNMLRSVTIMSQEHPGVCGICLTLKSRAAAQKLPGTEPMQSCWVECSVRTCRAQYVVEDVAGLRVRPKCYYCRTKQKCQSLACSRCSNWVIFPRVYRDAPDDTYLCSACVSGRKTVVSVDSTTKALIADNGIVWLGLRSNEDLFHGKSAFKLYSAHGASVFGPFAPRVETSLLLNLRGKPLHSPAEARRQIDERVGKGEIELGSCHLCFNDMSRSKLIPACGRSGCNQRVDEECLKQWYGRNKSGTLLNVMQLVCPFCRRIPTSKVISCYNREAATLGGLKQALEDRAYYHAWCATCGFAKRALERVCATDGELPTIENFRCEECTQAVRDELNNKVKLRVMPCPRCRVLVEKTSGCNHITCRCGAHWCFACGESFPPDEIYTHMTTAHGGIYDNDDDQEQDVEEPLEVNAQLNDEERGDLGCAQPHRWIVFVCECGYRAYHRRR